MILKKNILNKLKESIKNECSCEYGYFLKIIKLNKIKDSFISPNCENVFVVEFQAEVLKPVEGKKLEGEVCMIYPAGILLNIQNTLSKIKTEKLEIAKELILKSEKLIQKINQEI